MKFHLATASGNVVTAVGAGWIRIGPDEYRESLVLTPDTITLGWGHEGFDALTEVDFARLAEGSPEVVLLGTGSAIRFPPRPLTRALIDARIGFEVMDTPAACRTFNILAAEGRRVVAALLIE